MWIQTVISGGEYIRKVQSVFAYFDYQHPFVSINHDVNIYCADGDSCRAFYKEILSKLSDPTAVIKNEIITELGGLIDE